ncbi:MAG: hypothetical protein ACKO22_01105 [Cyanobium sp.]
MTLTPRLDILPPIQRQLWPSLRGLASAGFVLYGGTAIALRCGHRVSPEPSSDGVAVLAAPLDLLATKLKVLLQRAERKGYDDVAVLLASGLTLAEGLGAARALYGSAFPISEALKALVYLADGDLGDLRMPFQLWSASAWS